MKKIFLLIILGTVMISGAALFADGLKKTSHFAFGGYLVENAQDFGLGIDLTSPYFLWDHAAVRLSGEMSYDHLEWNISWLAKLGLIGSNTVMDDMIRLYAEGGALFIFPHTNLSDESWFFGGYGHFGFEFFIPENKWISYFIELGSIGTGFTAEKVSGTPHFINGFTSKAGLRIYF